MLSEMCCCGHALDHVGKPCAHPLTNQSEERCACQYGQRVDVATFRMLVDLSEAQARTHSAMMRLVAIAEHAANVQTRVVIGEDGRARVEMQQRPVVPQLIVPR